MSIRRTKQMLSLGQIWIYPIKSAKGLAVTESQLSVSGPVEDRRWMIVDQDGQFLSQRRLPRMALICPRMVDNRLVVNAPGMPPLAIEPWSGEGEWIPVRIWKDALRLPEPSERYSQWFTLYLGQPCKVVYLPDSVARPVEPPFDSPEWRVSLADGYPLLLLSEASIKLLNEKLTTPVTVERFRPNLVVSGAWAHAEDNWKRLRIGDVELAIVKPCARCSILLVDPETGERGLEPLRTLATYRRPERKVMFAQNALVTKPGTLRTGLEVEVLE